MNEDLRNIETCRGEDVLAEVSAAPQDPQFSSLVNEAIDPLRQQAFAQAGYDGYSEVVAQHKPYTFASAVIQMKSNLLLFLRALWLYPFGSGTIRSLSDMWSHYITRLSGNPEYGIPSRLSSLTDLPSAPTLLSDRKIGGADVPDGMSIIRLLCDKNVYNTITEISDSTYGWTLQNIYNAKTVFPNCTKVTIGCKEIDMTFFDYQVGIILGGTNQGCDCEYHFPNLKKITPKVTGIGYVQGIVGVSQTHDVYCPELEEIDIGSGFGFVALVSASNTEPYSIYMPKLRSANAPMFDQYNVNHSTGIETLVLGPIETAFTLVSTRYGGLGLPNLIHLEFGEGTCASLDLSRWSPTLDSSNLQQFLINFRDYIALRLSDNGSGLTLTLSQDVRDAVHAAESTYGIEDIIITQKGWTISPAPSQA